MASTTAPRLTDRLICILKPDTIQMYCGTEWGNYGENRLAPSAVIRHRPEIETLCPDCRVAWATELRKQASKTMGLVEYLTDGPVRYVVWIGRQKKTGAAWVHTTRRVAWQELAALLGLRRGDKARFVVTRAEEEDNG